MQLSVCLITRNEQAFLPGCLQSVANVADEIIIVDSASTDRTPEIARAAGARLVPHAWADDYSAPRNQGIAAARGDWILCMDADERLCTPDALRNCLQQAPSQAGGFLIERNDIVTSPLDGKTEVNPIGMVRLFRRHPLIRYVGIVHERPGDTILSAGFQIHTAAGVKLSHLVNQLSPERLRAKQEKYLLLLAHELASDPQNHWARYYRGKTLWYLERFDEAEAEFRRVATASPSRNNMRALAWDMLGALLLERGATAAAEEAIHHSLSLQPTQSLAYCVLGDLYYRCGHYTQAIDAYRRVQLSLAATLPAGQVHGDLYMTPEKQAYRIGCCHLAMGELDAALQQFANGIAANPDDAGCYYGTASVAHAMGQLDAARQLLRECIQRDPTWQAPRTLLQEPHHPAK